LRIWTFPNVNLCGESNIITIFFGKSIKQSSPLKTINRLEFSAVYWISKKKHITYNKIQFDKSLKCSSIYLEILQNCIIKINNIFQKITKIALIE